MYLIIHLKKWQNHIKQFILHIIKFTWYPAVPGLCLPSQGVTDLLPRLVVSAEQFNPAPLLEDVPAEPCGGGVLVTGVQYWGATNELAPNPDEDWAATWWTLVLGEAGDTVHDGYVKIVSAAKYARIRYIHVKLKHWIK